MYNTTYFPWSNLVYYTLMNMFGHFFVNTSNLNFERKHILYSSHSKYRDFLLVFVFAPIFFIISSIIVLRAPNDLSSTKGSQPHSWWSCFMFNQFAWASAYFAGLQFTHFDKGPMQQFSLNPDRMKTWPGILWVLLLVCSILILGIIGYLLWAYIMCERIYWYIGWGALIVLSFVLITVILRKTHTLHVHHYTIGMILIALIGY